MSVSMTSAVNAVKAVFDQREWRYTYDEERKLFSLKFNLSKTKLGGADIRIFVRPSRENESNARLILSYGEIDLTADSECMAQVAEYLTRANFGLSVGNFELDFRDGEIRYKVSINCVDALPGEDAIDDLCGIPVSMFNHYGNGLLAVSMGMMTAEEAIAKLKD